MSYLTPNDQHKFSALRAKFNYISAYGPKLARWLDVPQLYNNANSIAIPYVMVNSKIVSEYDQKIPQSQTADNPVAL